MTKMYRYFALAGLLLTTAPVWATGIPVYSLGEVVEQAVDQFQSNMTRGLVEVHNELVRSSLDALGGPNSFDIKKAQKELKKSLELDPPSEAISAYDGLMVVLGPKSRYGEIAVKKCGCNVPEVKQRLDETIVNPTRDAQKSGGKGFYDLTTEKRAEMDETRAASIERASTSGLAKAWTVQNDTAKVAEALDKTQEELDNAESQLAVIMTILRLQEESQKNLNSRLSLMSDDLIQSGLSALDNNM